MFGLDSSSLVSFCHWYVKQSHAKNGSLWCQPFLRVSPTLDLIQNGCQNGPKLPERGKSWQKSTKNDRNWSKLWHYTQKQNTYGQKGPK